MVVDNGRPNYLTGDDIELERAAQERSRQAQVEFQARSPLPNAALLTEHELAARWCTSVKTLQNARVKGGSVAYVKLGRLVRYRLQDIEAHEAANLHHSTSEVRR